MVAFAQMGSLFAMSWLLVLLAGSTLGARSALAAIGAGILLFSLAECLYDAVQGPLTAELAPPGLTGRYMAVNGFSWQLGFIIGPAVGAAVLGAAPHVLWALAAGACAAAGAYALALERRLPGAARLTPVAEARTGTR
jgi:hypothetical protein